MDPTHEAATVSERADAPRKDHVAGLDGLRGIAVLLVLWQHIPPLLLPYAVFRAQRAVVGEFRGGDWPVWIDAIRDAFLQAGYLGVDLFFVLSGFLITRILRFDLAAGVPLRHFLARRFLRIFPIYYLTLIAVGFAHPGPELWSSALYLSNFWLIATGSDGGWLGHTWSLAVEEHFYLVWPLAVYLLSDRRARRVAGCVVLLAILTATVWASLHVDQGRVQIGRTLQMGTPFRALSLSLGALIAFGESAVRGRARAVSLAAPIAVAVGYGVQFLPTLTGGSVASLALQPVLRFLGFAMVATAIVAAVIVRTDAQGLVMRMLRGRALRYVGRISYGLYLYHLVVYHALGIYTRDVSQPSAALWMAAAILLSFAVATLSYTVLERPILRFADRFRRRSAPAPFV